MAADREETRSYVDSGLDFSTDDFEPAEKAAMLKWYAENHDYKGLDLSPFARFWIETDPGGFKMQKRHVIALEETCDGASLPMAAGVLMYTHTYAAVGNGKGALYEIIACRALGLTRAQILEVIRMAGLFGGPGGMNPLAEIIGDYLNEWTEEGGPSVTWPEGWSSHPDTFRSGIDHSTDELTPDEGELLRAWYVSMYGELPAHVSMAMKMQPKALKALRIREEKAVTGALPDQMIPLLRLHLSLTKGWWQAARRSTRMGQVLGLKRHHLLSALLWAGMAGGELFLEEALGSIGDLLEGMD